MMIRQPKNMERRVLIANRGEIASRVAKACRELGHTAIGIFTDNEPQGTHLQFCDEWVYLEGNTNAETYLNVEKLVALAKEIKADGVHPGYGFLSENRDFANALSEAGITFIGPHVEAIRVMGDKATSKKLANEAGVPTVPGTDHAVPTVDEAVQIADKIGYPVLLKAVAGGGGRGMRACNNEAEVREQFDAVGREAAAAFNNGDLLVEKLIVNPRHIEVQILADKKGNTFHFFERECSVQRRHQKIIEEAPSPFIGSDEELRQRVCETAVKLAKAVEYDSAGTVEFIMGEDKQFYFLEMNTRIQVEHPITEEITGMDLIVCMIQAAFGDELGIPSQEFIRRSGHAIECRICAEDPITMLPAPGLVTGFETNFPQGTRFDHCLYKGLEVTPDFDPMVGKLVCKGIVRDVAVRKMNAALDGLFIEGLKTNLPLLKEIMTEKNFVDGHYSTAYIGEVAPQNNVKTDLDHIKLYTIIAGSEARRMGI
ncbi:ATP-grasp domain protein [Halobacteriovorax sp. BALOs_7]|uniref:ATP-grasp domain-containing protein n=1 Tax=Halobacteriovorax vibrionivorans TaxID=2152716 RepID=A0ABY0IIW1_9BACT|nr:MULTISPECIES: biotin carboxylase N-terminal domain-containing protein [Halobacteriovorax]AYF45865.1 ATP-grasp domain protein [Halobacteriovorax sp. BALOs_7]RZF22904.1 ATP-grasp domain-containing protein [Halobacteriovorax vibrionivorans]TGD47303.1 ATP-grasp domain-containing protein [Halobacteriovorax sp. Y22]